MPILFGYFPYYAKKRSNGIIFTGCSTQDCNIFLVYISRFGMQLTNKINTFTCQIKCQIILNYYYIYYYYYIKYVHFLQNWELSLLTKFFMKNLQLFFTPVLGHLLFFHNVCFCLLPPPLPPRAKKGLVLAYAPSIAGFAKSPKCVKRRAYFYIYLAGNSGICVRIQRRIVVIRGMPGVKTLCLNIAQSNLGCIMLRVCTLL